MKTTAVTGANEWKAIAGELAEALAEIAGIDALSGQHVSAGIAKNALARYDAMVLPDADDQLMEMEC